MAVAEKKNGTQYPTEEVLMGGGVDFGVGYQLSLGFSHV